MIERSDDYVEYCRETAKHARDLHDLSLRGRWNKELTRRVHERIIETVALSPEDELVDIGCGDGTLLRMARDLGARSAIGFLATKEEAALVRRTGVDARQAFSDQLPLPDNSASVVVCNNVLLIVPRERIPSSLREIWRVAKPGARIFIGEIPFVPQKDPTPQFTNGSQMLSYLYREHGLRAWLGMLRRMIWWKIIGRPFVNQPGTAVSFFATAEEFGLMARETGLELVRHWQHEDPNDRNDYLFRKLA